MEFPSLLSMAPIGFGISEFAISGSQENFQVYALMDNTFVGGDLAYGKSVSVRSVLVNVEN